MILLLWKIHILFVKVKNIPNIIFNIKPIDIPSVASPGILYEPISGMIITLNTTPTIILKTKVNIF